MVVEFRFEPLPLPTNGSAEFQIQSRAPVCFSVCSETGTRPSEGSHPEVSGGAVGGPGVQVAARGGD